MANTADTLNISERTMDPRVTLHQIGGMNVMATSGGRAHLVQDGLELPVASGYRVRVTLAASDTYTVQRIMRRGVKCFVKGTLAGVHAEDLGETVYVAGCFRNRSFGAHKVGG